MSLPLPGHGRFRRRLALLLGRDEAAGDQLWRRVLHGSGSFVLVYYLVPNDLFLVPKLDVLLLALALALALDAARLARRLALPTIRPYEAGRPASFAFYAVALVVAVVFFPEAIAVAVVLGTAFVDPLVGELRQLPSYRRLNPALPWAVYLGLAVTGLAGVGRWPVAEAVGLSALAATVGVGAERLRYRWLDDDLTMTLLPAVALYLVGVVALGLPA